MDCVPKTFNFQHVRRAEFELPTHPFPHNTRANTRMIPVSRPRPVPRPATIALYLLKLRHAKSIRVAALLHEEKAIERERRGGVDPGAATGLD